MLKKIALIFLIVFGFLSHGDVLLWTIDSTATVDGNSIYSFVSPLPDDDDNWAVGRLKVITGSGEVIYPVMASSGGDMNTPPDYYPGEEGVWIGGGGDFWGAEWNQSILTSDIDSTAMFAIELGLNHYNSLTDTIDFELLAITDEHAYDSLQTFMYPIDDLNPMTSTPWTPTEYHTVPEPSPFFLFIFGMAILVLIRKKCVKIS